MKLRGAVVILAVAAAACSSSSRSAPTSRPAATGTTTTTTGKRAGSRVSIWGDSLSVQAEDELRAQGHAHGLDVSVMAFFGLAPCDIAKNILGGIAAGPDAVVLAFSGNNLSSCMEKAGVRLTGAAYFAAYRRDIGTLVAAAVTRKIPVLVVGPPVFPDSENVPDRVTLNAVYREVVAAHPGARYVATTPAVTPHGFTRVLPCLPGETKALGCADGEITVRGGNGIHFDDPRTVACPGNASDHCTYTAGGRRYADAIVAGLAEVPGLTYVSAPADAGVPADKPEG